MDTNDIQKTYDYNRIKPNKTIPLLWIRNVVFDLFHTGRLTDNEYAGLMGSLLEANEDKNE